MPSPKPLIPPPWKVEIVASDISYASLRTGQEGPLPPSSRWNPWITPARPPLFRKKAADKYKVQVAIEGTHPV